MKMLNNNGPSIEPWGTPAIMFPQVLEFLFFLLEIFVVY